MRFPSLNKVKPVEEERAEPQPEVSVIDENRKEPVEPVETAPPMDDAERFEENQKEIVRTLTAHGIQLVLRSEQSLDMEEEQRRELESRLEENERIKKSLQELQLPVEEQDEYLLKVANFYHLIGRSKEAMEMYESILRKNPSKMAALNNAGIACDADGRYEEAVQFFDSALSKAPENVHVLSNKGITLYKDEKYQQALECFEAALKTDSAYVNALTFKAHSLYRLGKNAEALDCYNKVIRLDGANAEALYNKACLCSLKGDSYGSITSLEKAIRLDPSWKDAAVQDRDLDGIRQNPRFMNAVK